jgi:hypothetical protein
MHNSGVRALSMGVLVSMMLASLVLVAGSSEAAPVSQILRFDGESSNELFDNRSSPSTTSISALLNNYTGDNANYLYDDTPGTMYWGAVSSATVGTFGVGQIILSIADLVGERADYYNMTVQVLGGLVDSTPYDVHTVFAGHSNALSWRMGVASGGSVSYSDMYLSSGVTPVPLGAHYYAAGGYGNLTTLGTNHWATSLTWPIMNLDYDRPWTDDEVDDMMVVIELRCDAALWASWSNIDNKPVRFCLRYAEVTAIPVTTYTPAAPVPAPTGSFILRPDSDITTFGWESTEATYYEAVNETQYHGDASTSYINSTWTMAHTMTFGFEDAVVGWDTSVRFSVKPWVIAKETATTIDPLALAIYDSDDPSETAPYGLFNIGPSWTNYSATANINHPITNTTWTYDQLSNIRLSIGFVVILPATGELQITQIAILVSPSYSYIPSSNWDFGLIADWLGGSGITTIIGVLGFGLLIAVPSMAVIAYRDGDSDAFGSVVHAAVLMVIGFGFFLVGLIG